MSHPANTLYLEQKSDDFDSALSAGDYALAKTIVQELKSNGFTNDAIVLREVLLEKPVIDFNNSISPYI